MPIPAGVALVDPLAGARRAVAMASAYGPGTAAGRNSRL
jgi:hypothetical protein